MASVKQNKNTELEMKIKAKRVNSLIYFYKKHYGQCKATLLLFLIPRPLAAGSFRLIGVQGLPWGLIPFIQDCPTAVFFY